MKHLFVKRKSTPRVKYLDLTKWVESHLRQCVRVVTSRWNHRIYSRQFRRPHSPALLNKYPNEKDSINITEGWIKIKLTEDNLNDQSSVSTHAFVFHLFMFRSTLNMKNETHWGWSVNVRRFRCVFVCVWTCCAFVDLNAPPRGCRVSRNGLAVTVGYVFNWLAFYMTGSGAGGYLGR